MHEFNCYKIALLNECDSREIISDAALLFELCGQEYTYYDPKDCELFQYSVKFGETQLDAHFGTDVQIVRNILV